MPKMLLNVDLKAKIVIESELRVNVRLLALRMYLCAIGRHFTKMNAYFLVMNSKRCTSITCLQ